MDTNVCKICCPEKRARRLSSNCFPWVNVGTVSRLHSSTLHPHHLAPSVTKPITVKHVSPAPMPSTSPPLTETPSCASGVSVGLTNYWSSQQKVTLQWRQKKIFFSFPQLFFWLLCFSQFGFTLKTLLLSSPVWFCGANRCSLCNYEQICPYSFSWRKQLTRGVRE